jgi:hypothetical protein
MHLSSTPDLLRRQLRRHPLLAPGAVAAAVATTALYVGQVDPNHPGHYPTCPLYYATGLYCPGCGCLRMIHALANGHLGEAFHRNALLFVMLPLLAYLYGRWTLRLARGRPLGRLPDPRLIWAFLAVVGVFTVLRNLPMFHFLAPA